MTEQERTADECLIHNLSGCEGVCAIGCAPGTCDCECSLPDCPIPWLDMKEFAR